MGDAIPPPGAERDAEIGALLGVDPARRAIATEDGTSSALTEDDPRGSGLGGYKITAGDVRDFCRKHPRYHVGVWEFWPPYSTDPAACDRLVEAMRQRFWCLSIQVNDAGDTSGLVAYGANFYKRRSFARDAPDPGGGVTMSDAVSAAALLALRGGR